MMMTTERIVDLGFSCPACGESQGFAPTGMWNRWECVVCLTQSSIREEVMEILPRPQSRRTEMDDMLDNVDREEEPDWATSNRAFCLFIHRGRKHEATESSSKT